MKKLASILFLILGLSPALADGTINTLSAGSTIVGTESIPMFQTANPAVKTTPSAIATYFQTLVGGDCTMSGGTITCTKINGNAIGSGIADDQLIVGTGASTTAFKTVPDCTDTGGNHINYTQSSNAFSCGTSSSGGGSLPSTGYVASEWHYPAPGANLATGGALGANVIRCWYGYVPTKLTISQLGVRVSTAGTNLQLAIYQNASGRPGALVGATGSIDVTGAAGAKTGALSANKQVGPGGTDGDLNLWWCWNVDNGATVIQAWATANSVQGVYVGSTSSTNFFISSATVDYLSCTGAACNGGSSTFNTWPATLAGTTWSDGTNVLGAAIGFLVNSVP